MIKQDDTNKQIQNNATPKDQSKLKLIPVA